MGNKIKKITLKDIAARCNLSISTVSRALRNEGDIAFETKRKVFMVARELGYLIGEREARITKEGNHKLIGLIISDIENMYFHSLARAVEDTVAKNGYSLILCNTDEDIEIETEYMQLFLRRGVDGVILSPAGERIPWYNEFVKMNIPIVVIDREIDVINEIDYVGVNNREASRRSTEYLINLGHKRIAILLGDEKLITFRQRLEGYLEALEKNSIKIDSGLIIFAKTRGIESGIKAVENLLISDIEPPTALFCVSNLMTLGSYIAAKKAHISIPSQLSVLGFDDFQWSEALNPPLTAVSQPTYAIGLTAAQILLRRIERGGMINKQKVIIDVQLIERDSCKKLIWDMK